MKNYLPIPTESEEQQALFEWKERMLGKYPELKLLHHIPNEGKRSVSTGARMRREGLVSGVPDIHLPVPSGTYHGLYIELKRIKHSKVTPEQEEFIAMLNKYDNFAVICYGWEEAVKVIEWYLKGATGPLYTKKIIYEGDTSV